MTLSRGPCPSLRVTSWRFSIANAADEARSYFTYATPTQRGSWGRVSAQSCAGLWLQAPRVWAARGDGLARIGRRNSTLALRRPCSQDGPAPGMVHGSLPSGNLFIHGIPPGLREDCPRFRRQGDARRHAATFDLCRTHAIAKIRKVSVNPQADVLSERNSVIAASARR